MNVIATHLRHNCYFDSIFKSFAAISSDSCFGGYLFWGHTAMFRAYSWLYPRISKVGLTLEQSQGWGSEVCLQFWGSNPGQLQGRRPTNYTFSSPLIASVLKQSIKDSSVGWGKHLLYIQPPWTWSLALSPRWALLGVTLSIDLDVIPKHRQVWIKNTLRGWKDILLCMQGWAQALRAKDPDLIPETIWYDPRALLGVTRTEKK